MKVPERRVAAGDRIVAKKRSAVSLRSADTQRRLAVNGAAVRESLAGFSATDWRKDNIGRLLLYAFHAFESRMIDGYRAAGFDDVRQVHLNAIRHVDVKNGTRIVDLAARAGVTKGAMGQMLEDCVRHDLVKIKPDPTDSRAKLVKLSARGARFMSATGRSVASIQEDFEEMLGSRDYEKLIQLLRTFHDGIEASDMDAD